MVQLKSFIITSTTTTSIYLQSLTHAFNFQLGACSFKQSVSLDYHYDYQYEYEYHCITIRHQQCLTSSLSLTFDMLFLNHNDHHSTIMSMMIIIIII